MSMRMSRSVYGPLCLECSIRYATPCVGMLLSVYVYVCTQTCRYSILIFVFLKRPFAHKERKCEGIHIHTPRAKVTNAGSSVTSKLNA
jgi:hypothetical protein